MNDKEISRMFEEWEEEQHLLEELRLNKDNDQLASLMNKYIDYVKEIVILCNVKSNGRYVKPLNFEERISFIEHKPTHRHSIIQLVELYKEMKKKYAILKI